MAKAKDAGATAEPQKPRFCNAHFRPDAMYMKALMGRYPSAKSPQYRADELRYWYDRMEAAGLDPRTVERRCPRRVAAEAEALTRRPSRV